MNLPVDCLKTLTDCLVDGVGEWQSRTDAAQDGAGRLVQHGAKIRQKYGC